MNTAEQSKAIPQTVIDKLGLKLSATFVPFSQSRNRGEKHPSLNWKVTLFTLSPLDGQRRDILTTDYMAGSAHCFAYKQAPFGKRTADDVKADIMVRWECETGGRAKGVNYKGREVEAWGVNYRKEDKRQPDLVDVVYSLVMDASVIDAGSFEEWATEFGYDTDSREAEKTYQACLDTALKLRRGIGEAGLAELREAFQDY